MLDLNIPDLAQEWIDRKIDNPSLTIEQFLMKHYLICHQNDSGNEQEKSQTFHKRFESWKQTRDTCHQKMVKINSIEEWQASEMLSNVIQEYRMGPLEEYHYLLNVELLCLRALTGRSDKYAELIRQAEQKYHDAWDQQYISKFELQELYRRILHFMQYAGIRYNDETRLILAKIGIAQDVNFEDIIAPAAMNDLEMLANFVVSEMILQDKDEELTPEERDALAEEIVPLCVHSTVSNMEESANGLLGAVCRPTNMSIFPLVGAVMLAAKVTIDLFALLGTGTIVAVGAGILWNLCKQDHTDENSNTSSIEYEKYTQLDVHPTFAQQNKQSKESNIIGS